MKKTAERIYPAFVFLAFIIHGDKDVIVSNELAEIQHKGICGSKPITLSNSGHGITYDELEKFNSIFLNAVNS